ncbi:hypothetical protein ACFFRR_003357 [Megaselia abdita]
MEQSRIPKPGGIQTRIPLPNSSRLSNIPNESKIGRPKSFFGLRPPSIFQSKKSIAGGPINSAKSFLHRKFATVDSSTPSKADTKVEEFFTPLPGTPAMRSDTFIRDNDQATPTTSCCSKNPKKLFRTQTYDKLEMCSKKPRNELQNLTPPLSSTFVNNVTQTVDGKVDLNRTIKASDTTQVLEHNNLTQTLESYSIKNATRTIIANQTKINADETHILEFPASNFNLTQTLDKNSNKNATRTINATQNKISESSGSQINSTESNSNVTRILKHFEANNATRTIDSHSYMPISNTTQTLKYFESSHSTQIIESDNLKISTPLTIVESTFTKPEIVFTDTFTKVVSTSHNHEPHVEQLEDMTSPLFDADETLKPSDETLVHQKILSSTINTEKLVDITNLSPRGVLNITEDVIESEPVNTTDLLCMTQVMDSTKNRYSFGLDLKDATLDCSIELVDSMQMPQIPSPMLKKQNSFEMDESLGILTPDQMKEFMDSAGGNVSNMDLPLSLQRRYSLLQMRVDQTPSPEDLPLDPIPVTITSTSKAVSSSFVTSITSVTSLDNGYQGDGEMSRPASRGPSEHNVKLLTSPHLPPIRRIDPMTDSDFFTESDADDVLHRGDRRAQVIDGQLYGPTLNPTAEVPQHQQPMDDSCMDSSGIFTDVDNRQEFDIEMSPDISTDTVKMVSEDGERVDDNNTQKAPSPNKSEEKSSSSTKSKTLIADTLVQKCKYSKKNINAISPTQTQNEKCGVVNDKNNIKLSIRKNTNMIIPNSKTPSPTSTTASSSSFNPLLRKTAATTLTPNKWDAVMNKIANNKAQIAKKNYSEVKSKISTGVVNGKKSPVAATADAAAIKGNLNDSGGNSNSGLVSPQTKRLQQGAAKRGRSYSQQSSQSDLSSSGASPKLSLKTPPRAAKKRDVRNLSISPCDQGPPAKAHQLLNGSSSRLKVQPQHLSQKRVTPPSVKSNINKQVPVQSKNSPKDQKSSSTTQKIANGGGKINPNGNDAKVQANIQIAVDDKETNTEFQNTKDVEALGVLIQYLVHELDAFSTPQYKRDYEKAKNNLTKTILHLEEAKTSCQSLQDQLETKDTYYLQREDELQNLHLIEISKVEDKLNEVRIEANQRVQYLETRIEDISAVYEKQLQEKGKNIDILQSQIESLNQRISQHVNNENELRDNIHKSEMEYSRKINSASVREKSLLDQIAALKQQLENKSEHKEHSLNLTPEELSILRSPFARNSGSPSKADSMQEIESLRCVLDLKLIEISKLQKQNQELNREAEENLNRSSKISTLENRLEDLQSKFEHKCEENTSLQEKFVTLEKKHNHDSQVRTQLSYDKEQLQYQLRQKAEQLHCLEEQFKQSINCSNLSILSNEDFIPTRNSSVIEMNDCSQPVSPLKLSIEKPNSISWVLEMDDETPRDAANKIVRRAGSFRSMSNPLSQSASATQINNRQSVHSNGNLRARSKSMSIKNNEHQHYTRQHSAPATKQRRSEILPENLIDFDDNDVFESTPSSKLITCDTSALVKPNKKKLKNTLIRESAGEAMVSSTNSEDEHCSASSEDLICSPSSSVTVSSSSSTTSLDRTVSRDRKNFRLWEESLSDIAPMDV